MVHAYRNWLDGLYLSCPKSNAFSKKYYFEITIKAEHAYLLFCPSFLGAV